VAQSVRAEAGRRHGDLLAHRYNEMRLQREAAKAKRSRAASIARQAQLDRQRALRDNATAALIERRPL